MQDYVIAISAVLGKTYLYDRNRAYNADTFLIISFVKKIQVL